MSKRIALSGATRGLGRALVPQFAAAKHIVAGCGRSLSHINELSGKFPAPHMFAAIDVSRAEAVQTWANDVIRTIGVPDLLIANAAIMLDPAPFWKVSAAKFDQIVEVNIKGVANFIRAFLPAMVEKKHGVVIALSSGWGRSASAEVAPYCTTKYAVEGLMQCLAKELPSAMAAIPLNPGVIDTDMLRQCWGEKAHTFPKSDAWAKRAAPYLLNLSAKDTGKSLSVPA